MIRAVTNGRGVRSVYRTVGDLEFHWLEAGPSSGRIVLMIHGFMAHSMAFRRVLPALAKHHRLIVPDLPAHGLDRSFRADTVRPELASLGSWLRIFRAQFAEPVDIVGHSLGATLAYRLAASGDARLRSLTLVAPGLRIPPSVLGAYALDRLPASVARLAANRLGLAFYSPLNWRGDPMDEVEARAYLAPLRDADRAGFMLQLGARLLEPAPLPEVRPLGIGTQVVWGELDHILPIEDAHWLADRLGVDALSIVAGSGHSPMEDRPAEFARIVGEFLQENS